jgi:hypothetical protein
MYYMEINRNFVHQVGDQSRLGHGCLSLVFVGCCVGRSLCNEPITVVCLIFCYLETSKMSQSKPNFGFAPQNINPFLVKD